MANLFQKRVLILALFAGEIMMKSGAEISRVESTIIRICRACHIDRVECFATTTGIFLSIHSGNDDDDMQTFIKRIDRTDIDLKKISAINVFARVFTSTDLTVVDGLEQLKKIEAIKPYPFLVRVLAAMVCGAFFVPYYFGGTSDIFCAALVSGAAYGLSYVISLLEFPPFIRIFVSCFVATALILLLQVFYLEDNSPAVIVSAVSIFMPGVAITNAARDMLAGDLLSGVARLVEALIAAIAIAGGIGMCMAGWKIINAQPLPAAAIPYPLWSYFFFGALITAGFAVLFNAPVRRIPVIAVIGGIGMISYQFLYFHGYSILASCFLGTFLVAILSEVASRAGKDATTIFILPGIIPFVPGAAIYRTMAKLLESDFEAVAQNGSETLMMVGGISIAIALVAALTRLGSSIIRRISRKGI
ncbi:MAG: threonine/serine exporter family protein [Clostridiales Family XIII bacterium]|jgi:uncharacterized membrane protein YjjP (DUF1212 family)|nr:threonine/serine exporter family protein [Clostridiales Family XIII bacterium]